MILEQLAQIRFALKAYPVAGIAPVESALERAIGAFTVSKQAVAKEVDNEVKSGVLSGVRDFVKKTVAFADSADKLQKGGIMLKQLGQAIGEAVASIPSP